MKPLPVIQPESSTPTPSPSDMKTAGMVSDPAQLDALRPRIVDAIKTVFDPEIPVNIWDLGLIYEILVDADAVAGVRMTLTAPNCPAAQWLPGQVEQKVRAVEGVRDVKVDVVFDPPWDRDRMSDAAKLQLGMW
jgi:FeS assembly SUF system protein